MNNRLIGSEREEQAAAFLCARGMEILVHSFRCRLGEIDLVARDGDTLVFVEVKYRYSGRFGWGEEHVDRKKQATIFQVARVYLNRYCREGEPPCRFDVVAIDGERIIHFPDAFGKY